MVVFHKTVSFLIQLNFFFLFEYIHTTNVTKEDDANESALPKQPEMKHLMSKVFHETLPRYAAFPLSRRHTARLQKMNIICPFSV